MSSQLLRKAFAARKLAGWSLAAAAVIVLFAGSTAGSPLAYGQGLCDDYTYQEDAQAAYDSDPDLYAGLDEDGDGVACEGLPRLGGPSGPPAAPTETPSNGGTTPAATPEGAVAGATYTGTIETAGDCGGGTVSVTTSSDGSSVVAAGVTNVSADGAAFSQSSTFAAGTVPIGDDGSFEAYFTHAGVHGVTINGTFDGSSLTGSVLIDPSTCGPLSFSAVAGATAAPTVAGLPSTGLGSGGSSGAPWAVIAGAMAAAGLAAGFVFLRRRSA